MSPRRVELLDAADDAGDGVRALHRGRREHDLGERPAALEHLADVVEDGAGLRRDDADACAGSAGSGRLRRLVEQALFAELRLQALELRLERADALGLHEVDITAAGRRAARRATMRPCATTAWPCSMSCGAGFDGRSGCAKNTHLMLRVASLSVK